MSRRHPGFVPTIWRNPYPIDDSTISILRPRPEDEEEQHYCLNLTPKIRYSKPKEPEFCCCHLHKPSKPSPEELRMLEKQSEEERIKKLPFWYRGDFDNPEIEKYDQNEYQPWLTIYDAHMNETLQPSVKKDWLSEYNLENEGIVPGYSLVRRCNISWRPECKEDPFIRDRKEWIDNLKGKIKEFKPNQDTSDYLKYVLAPPAYENHIASKFEPYRGQSKISQEEWKEQEAKKCWKSLIGDFLTPPFPPSAQTWKSDDTTTMILHNNTSQPKGCPPDLRFTSRRKNLVPKFVEEQRFVRLVPCFKISEYPRGLSWFDGTHYYPLNEWNYGNQF